MTDVKNLYDGFLAKISDYNILDASRTITEIEEELYDYLKYACRRFQKKCRQDLTIVEDSVTFEKNIVSELTIEEEDILIALMLVEYMKPNTIASRVIIQRVNDKDFQSTSQANHLQQLIQLSKMLEEKARIMIDQYRLDGMLEDWNK